MLAGIGRGDGLTPYGDDVACGWLATRYAAGLPTPADEVRAAGAADHAALGHACSTAPCTARCCPSSPRGWPGAGAPEEAALTAVGASSGRGLLEGARLALGAEAMAA